MLDMIPVFVVAGCACQVIAFVVVVRNVSIKPRMAWTIVVILSAALLLASWLCLNIANQIGASV